MFVGPPFIHCFQVQENLVVSSIYSKDGRCGDSFSDELTCAVGVEPCLVKSVNFVLRRI
jgi:hypothetical protein